MTETGTAILICLLLKSSINHILIHMYVYDKNQIGAFETKEWH